jgi:hypothetical protein
VAGVVDSDAYGHCFLVESIDVAALTYLKENLRSGLSGRTIATLLSAVFPLGSIVLKMDLVSEWDSWLMRVGYNSCHRSPRHIQGSSDGVAFTVIRGIGKAHVSLLGHGVHVQRERFWSIHPWQM